MFVHRYLQKLACAVVLTAGITVLSASAASASISPTPKPGTWGVDGRVWGMTRIGNVVYLGGAFDNAVSPDGLTMVPREHLAAIDTSTGSLLPWDPGSDAIVYALANDGTNVFVGGDFTQIGGVARARIAEVDPSGAVTSLVADATRKVRALAFSGTTLYAGGQFARVTDGSGVSRRRVRIAGLDVTTDRLTQLKATPNKSVLSLAVVPNGFPQAGNLVVGGIFDSMNGDATQSFLTEITPAGQLAGWLTHPIDLIWSVEVVNGTVYAGRGGARGGDIAAYDLLGKELWRHHADGDVQAVGFTNGQVIAGGHFNRIALAHIPRLAAFNPVGGAVDPTWVPAPDSIKGVWAIASTPTALDIGGDFTTVNGQTARRFAELEVSGSSS